METLFDRFISSSTRRLEIFLSTNGGWLERFHQCSPDEGLPCFFEESDDEEPFLFLGHRILVSEQLDSPAGIGDYTIFHRYVEMTLTEAMVLETCFVVSIFFYLLSSAWLLLTLLEVGMLRANQKIQTWNHLIAVFHAKRL